MTARMPDIPRKKTWRDDLATIRQLGMMSWLLKCRGITYRAKLGTTSPADLTKGKVSDIITKLLSHTSDDEIIKLLEDNDITIIKREKTGKSWQELVLEDIFDRSIKE